MTRLAIFSLMLTGCGSHQMTNAMDADMGGTYGGASAGGATEGGAGEPGAMTAGEWKDIDDWQLWNTLLTDQTSVLYGIPEFWGFEFAERIPIQVMEDERPVADIGLILRDADQQILWQARTDNTGHAELFAGMFGITGPRPYSLDIDGGMGVTTLQDIQPDPWNDFIIEVPAAPAPPTVDLMFVIDTTGSMSDELSYLQVELADMISRVHTEVGPNLDLRISVNFYRDHGDKYVIRSFPFTADEDQAVSDLEDQRADGGGDWPEAVDEALDDAIFAHDWRDRATSRLAFLVLDAPPHNDRESVDRMHAAVTGAAAQGVRIIPLAASGADKNTEALLRSIDIATGATYTFLTDHSGIGNDHEEPTIGQYEVEFLNDLLVRLVVESVQ